MLMLVRFCSLNDVYCSVFVCALLKTRRRLQIKSREQRQRDKNVYGALVCCDKPIWKRIDCSQLVHYATFYLHLKAIYKMLCSTRIGYFNINIFIFMGALCAPISCYSSSVLKTELKKWINVINVDTSWCIWDNSSAHRMAWHLSAACWLLLNHTQFIIIHSSLFIYFLCSLSHI